MSYLTFDDLKESRTFYKAEVINESLSGGKNLKYDKRIFLSYRRKDRQYVEPIVWLLKNIGVQVYIDYLDEKLPETPNSGTAEILRSRIRRSDKFILLATPNSKDSKWIPWELGLGDGFLTDLHVAILPLVHVSNYWGEQEYFSIYGRIEKANSRDMSKIDWAVFYPDGNAEWLIDWLLK